VESYQTLKELIPTFLYLFQETKKEGILPYLPYKASIFLTPKPRITRKGNYRPIFIMNIDTKPNKITAN
jgi:hypothetical protein